MPLRAPLERAVAVYTASLLLLAAGRELEQPAFPEIVHVDSHFDSGRNRHEWRTARTGTCAATSTHAAADHFHYSTLVGRLDGLAGNELFREGAFELRAVSGSSRVPNPDECGVFLYTVLGAEAGGALHNAGRPRGDFSADIRFRFETGTSVLTALLAFGNETLRYVALMIPASDISAVPYTAPGRAALMKPHADLEGDNSPIPPGRDAVLSIRYRRATNTAEAFIDGRPVVFSHVLTGGPRRVLVAEREHEVEPYPAARPVARPSAILELYSEAQLDAAADSRVEILGVRFTSRRPSFAVEWAERVHHALTAPLRSADISARLLLGRARRKALVLLER